FARSHRATATCGRLDVSSEASEADDFEKRASAGLPVEITFEQIVVRRDEHGTRLHARNDRSRGSCNPGKPIRRQRGSERTGVITIRYGEAVRRDPTRWASHVRVDGAGRPRGAPHPKTVAGQCDTAAKSRGRCVTRFAQYARQSPVVANRTVDPDLSHIT